MHERTTDTAETATPLPENQGRSYTPRESQQGRAMTSVDAGRLAGRPRASREPLVPVDRLLLTLLAGMFVLAAGIVSAGAVAFSSLSGQMLGLQEQIGGIHEEIGGFREEIGGLRGEIGGLRAEMHAEIGRLSERMTRIETLIETHLVPASNARNPAGS